MDFWSPHEICNLLCNDYIKNFNSRRLGEGYHTNEGEMTKNIREEGGNPLPQITFVLETLQCKILCVPSRIPVLR